ncbi:MAG TPA: TSUP family transporter [Oligoflexus sp.]|uniref:TSUP family transporter n=1 Tax=Oligoflexus sp. TaxID=1971216 RepID=UPI002D42395C|nr:TSUP family transporter [Oligoflexus sp.]HYX35256.1 TSUP family transporter [Oligoflexus sp.]
MTVVTLSILFTVLITSTLSGVLGMGGGMLLMGVLVALLPMGQAMILHGIAQLFANGSRALLHARHIKWSIMPFYAAGAFVAYAGFAWLNFIPDVWLIYLIMGFMPWVAIFGRRWMVLQIEKPQHAVACGLLVTLLQLACGVSGPALDIFYLHTSLGRHSIVSTKALTQTLGHALKLIYYGNLLAHDDLQTLGLRLPLSVCVITLLGTAAGGFLLNQANDQNFQKWSRRILLGIGTIYLYQGGHGLWRSFASAWLP